MNPAQTNRRNLLIALSLVVGAAALLPQRGDCGQNECSNTTTSLASTVNNPVAGDEQFFTLPVGTTNLMILLDTSGSMGELPQCGDGDWGNSNLLASCRYPTLAAASGTCDVRSNTNLSWMHDYAPTATYVDPGNGIEPGNGLVDRPTWGTGCTGNNCLFQPSKIYRYASWNETSATSQTTCTTSFTYSTYSMQGGNCTNETKITLPVTAPIDACNSCLFGGTPPATFPTPPAVPSFPGFYFYRGPDYQVVAKKNGSCNSAVTNRSDVVFFSGGWLNANPPKFMSARKVIKDTIWIDTTKAASNSDSARFGLAFFSSDISTGTGAQIIVPLGPDKAHSYPADTTVNKAAMAAARQLILDALNHRNWPTGGLPSLAAGGTPMSAGLFRMGQYFSQPGFYATGAGSTNFSGFGTSYELKSTGSTYDPKADFTQTAKGTMNASWVDANQCSICWSCQTSAVIMVTDGSPNEYNATPTPVPSSFNTYAPTPYQSNCGTSGANCVSPADGHQSPVSRIAYWLNNNDLRPGLIEPVLNQVVSVSPISINLPAGAARNILTAVANMGGGTYINADDGKQLADALTKTVQTYNNRANSFSAPAASSLSTIHAVSSEAFITRFKPNEVAPFWEGHLYQVNLFDSFMNGCDPTRDAAHQPQVACGGKFVPADFNSPPLSSGLANCAGVFMVDKSCDEITEYTGDPIPGGLQPGDFVKKGTGNLPANLVWDAGKVLSYPTQVGYRAARESQANSRKILSAIPATDGGFEMVPFDTVAADVAKLAPFMNLTTAWCTTMLTVRAKVCGTGETGVPACPTNATDFRNLCARQVIHFVRGWDVTDNNANGCYGPDRGWTGTLHNATTCASGILGEERDRPNDARTTPVFWKLGDIFHSSPVVVKPPVLEAVCDTGYDNQCVATIHSPPALRQQTAYASYTACRSGVQVDAYEAWRYDNRDRRRVLLVGSNDGMLHAFDAGSPITSAARDLNCNVPYGTGTGEERWAFVPPDMLPRLKDLMGDKHQYTVDGNVMARDVWVDANANRTKEKGEFHSVAIFSERAGGTQYVALDVTDVEAPRMLWTFPPPGSVDAQWMGQSWSDFSPRPAPIGPVRLALPTGQTDTVNRRDFEERWIAMLNGGYDPSLSSGNAVWMVDVWTGAVVWRFTDDDFKAQNGYGSGTSMYAVPGAVALMDIGDPAQPSFDGDGYFDTATWGDMGGSLFVARFLEPGQMDLATGRVTNWPAARTFEQQRRNDDLQYASGRAPFFFMTANAFEPQNRALHVYAGSGNRERIMQQGEACGPDNLLGCCRGGCSVTDATSVDAYGACGFTNHFRCESGKMMRDSVTSTCTGTAACAASPGNQFTTTVTLNYTCPSVPARTDTGSVSCDANGTCGTLTSVGDTSVVASFAGQCPKNRFYGVLAYGGYAEKVFTDAASARVFEANRYTDTATSFVKTSTCTSTTSRCNLVDTTWAETRLGQTTPTCVARADGVVPTSCSATAGDPGWFYEYGDTCPVGAGNCGNLSACKNEKTGSQASIVFGCTVWNGFVPVGAQSGSDPCSGKVGTPLVYGYAANYVSGIPSGSCGFSASPYLYRASQRSTVAPPSGGIFRVAVSAKGEVGYSSLQIDPGASPTSIQPGTRSDIAEPVYWLEVPRPLHDCRHDGTKTGAACP